MPEHDNKNRYVSLDRGNRAVPHRSHPRYCALKLLLDRLTDIVYSDALAPGDTVVDFGCGNKPYQHLFKEKFRQYLGADLLGNADAQIIIGRRGELPLADASIDCVLSTQVLEHVEDPRFYLAEAYRVLKPDGSLILSTHGNWPYHPDPTDFWRWTVDGLRREITTAGFDIWRTQSVLGMASYSIQLWQDATLDILPRVVRPLYIRGLQTIIGVIQRRDTTRLSVDASIYIVHARKRSLPQLSSAEEEDHRLALATVEATAHIPPAAHLILVDQNELGSTILPGRQVVPFLERQGRYWGPPKNDREALREFERLRQAGATFVVFAWPAFWWLDHYVALANRLRTTWRCVLDNDRLIVFDVSGSAYKTRPK